MHITTMGIILREKAHDDDRILTILTEDHGVLTAYARGAKKLRGRLLSSTELLCYSRFVLFWYKDRYVVDEAESERNFFGLRQDVFKLSLANYLAQLTVELAPKGEPAGEYLRLVLNSLSYLEGDKRSLPFIKAVFELRILTMAGYMPNLVACSECGSFEADWFRFVHSSGDIVCQNCGVAISGPHAIINMGVLTAMRHIIYAPFEKLFAFTLGEENLKKLSAVTETYLINQIEAYLPALNFYKSL